MSRAASFRPLWPSCIALLLFILMLTSTLRRGSATPLWNFTFTLEPDNLTTASTMVNSTSNLTDSSMENWTEITPYTDVYVIKAVVYEIGILTDTDNTTSSESSESSENSESTERHERIDISLYSVPQEDEFS